MRIWTIGHSTRTIDEFISILKENGIKLLADVRTWPGSKRYPQFNKEKLMESLNAHGIRYEHFPELGGKRKPNPDSRNTAWRNASFRGYADYMETPQFQKGIERLLYVAAQGAAPKAFGKPSLPRVPRSCVPKRFGGAAIARSSRITLKRAASKWCTF
jgi:uncharacterized protein (DUF488 family)